VPIDEHVVFAAELASSRRVSFGNWLLTA